MWRIVYISMKEMKPEGPLGEFQLLSIMINLSFLSRKLGHDRV